MKRCLPLKIIIFSLLHSIGISIGQPNVAWVRYFNNGEINNDQIITDLFATSDGGFAFCGYSGFPTVIWICKTTADGEEDWSRTYSRGKGNSIIQCDDDGYICVGGNGDVIVVRTDENGDTLWLSVFGTEFSDNASGVIELKSNQFALCGSYYNENNRSSDGFVALIDENGDLIWLSLFGDDQYQDFVALRETEDGIVAAGRHSSGGGNALFIVKCDFEGERLWERRIAVDNIQLIHPYDMTSCNGGFAITGTIFYPRNSFTEAFLQRINNQGEAIWRRTYLSDLRGNYRGYTGARGVLWTGDGFALACNGANDNESLLIRTDGAGNEHWRFSEQFGDGFSEALLSLRLADDGGFVAAGYTRFQDERRAEGVMAKFTPDSIGPYIIHFEPESLGFPVLIGDEVEFLVRVVNNRPDSLRYRWTVNDEEANGDSTLTVNFDEFGTDSVKCVVVDGALEASVQWTIEVTELYISHHTPEFLNLRLRRRESVDFSVQARAVEGGQIHYLWELDGDEVGDDRPAYSHQFNEVQVEPYILTATAYRGEASDTVMWEVYVRSAVWAWWPREFEVSVAEGDSLEFSMEPFDPESPNLAYRWYLDGGAWPDSAAGAGAEVAIGWDDAREHSVSVMVRDGEEADSLAWQVRVYDPAGVEPPDRRKGGGSDGWTGLPTKLDLSIAPNPFNDAAEVRFALPQAGEVRLGLYDISGRLVATLADGRFPAGYHSVPISSSSIGRRSPTVKSLPTGIYFIRLQSANQAAARKVVVMR